MKPSTYLFFLVAFLVIIFGCSVPKPVSFSSYPPLIDSLAMRDTIQLSDWEVGDSQWQRMENLSPETLIELTNHPKGNIKFFAVRFLINKQLRGGQKSIDFFKILKEHLYDTSTVIFNSQYTKPEKVTTGECFLQLIGGYRFSSYILSTGYFFYEPSIDTKELRFIDSMLVCNEPFYKESTVDFPLSIRLNPNIKPCILERILKYKNKNFTTTLARFQDLKDVSLILENLSVDTLDRRQTMRWFPFYYFQNRTFFKFLKQNWKRHWQDRHFIENVAKYQSRESVILLDSMYEVAKKIEKHRFSRITEIGRHVETNYDALSADLYLKILSENPENGNLYSWNHKANIWKDRPKEMYFLFLKWQEIDSKNTRQRIEISFPYVIEYLEQNDPEALVKTVIYFLKNHLKKSENSYMFRKSLPYFSYIKDSGNKDFASQLFEILKNEKNGMHRFFLKEFILDFSELNFKGKLISFFNKNPDLQPIEKEAAEGRAIFKNFLESYKYKEFPYKKIRRN